MSVAAFSIFSMMAELCIRIQPDKSDRTVEHVQTRPRESLASIQHQLRTAQEFDAQLRVTVAYQGPFHVRIAWRKPDFIFIHVAGLWDNPAEWYWYENQQLCVYEVWPARGARGVCVTNVLQLAEGDAERAFELVLSKSESFTAYGNVGLRLLQLVQEVAAAQLDINETETAWQLTATPDAFNAKVIEPYMEGSDNLAFVVFELPRSTRPMAKISSVHVGLETVPPESAKAGHLAEFESLQFSFDRERLKFPKLPTGLMKTIQVKDAEALNSEIIDSLRPIPIAE